MVLVILIGKTIYGVVVGEEYWRYRQLRPLFGYHVVDTLLSRLFPTLSPENCYL